MKKITHFSLFCLFFFLCFTSLQASEFGRECNDKENCEEEQSSQNLIGDFEKSIDDLEKTTVNTFQSNQRPFITTWKTDNPGLSNDNQITIKTYIDVGLYNYQVDWGDGTSDASLRGDVTHTYATSGTYTVGISGIFPGIQFFTANSDNKKLISIEQWGDIEWVTMRNSFYNCINMQGNFIDKPDLSRVESMGGMFYNAKSFNHPIGDWNVSNVGFMQGLFRGASAFNQDIGDWNVGKAYNTAEMFRGASTFNQDIGDWNVNRVSYMEDMFRGASSFNQDISNWDVSRVNNTKGMFRDASAFNQDIGAWDLSNVTDIQNMFIGAKVFNQDLSAWDVSNVRNMGYLFSGAFSFNQNISSWDISSVTNMREMLFDVKFSVANYEALLKGWSSLPNLQSNVTFQGASNQYCDVEAVAARQKLIDDFGWTITDGGKAENCEQSSQKPFITTWKTDNPGPTGPYQIQIATAAGEVYDYTIEWGDGSSDSNVTGDITHTYAAVGTYAVSITGTFPRIQFSERTSSNREKLLSIDQWGDIEWTSMEQAFFLCENVQGNFTDSPDLSKVTNMSSMFNGASSFNHPVGNWDVSNVTNMNNTFNGITSAFDQDISSWNVSNVTTMNNILRVSNLSIENYDALLNGWSSLPSLQSGIDFIVKSEFCNAEAARQKLITDYGWIITDNGKCGSNVSKPFMTTWKTDNPGPSNDYQITIPTATGEVYDYTINWGDGNSDTGLAGNSTHTYSSPGTYTVSISGTFPRIHFETSATDRQKLMSIEQWGDIKWTSMKEAFKHCANLEGNFTDSPNLLGVNDMQGMFYGAKSFNHPIGDWNVTNATNMSYMFIQATAFNQDIGDWEVEGVQNMANMFYQATAFDQDLGSWTISSVKDMSGMLYGVNLSVENYDSLLNGWLTNGTSIFGNVRLQGGNNKYCTGEAARQKLIDVYGWNITDGGKADNCGSSNDKPFVTTWKTDNPGPSSDYQITIPTAQGEVYDYTVDWGDGSSDTSLKGNTTHTYSSPGTYTVSISGTFPRIHFETSQTDRQKLMSIEQWGDIQWSSMKEAFLHCANLEGNFTDRPNLLFVSDMQGMFYGAKSFNHPIGNWDVSNVENMSYLFIQASSFNQDLSNWNVSKVTNMDNMFYQTTSFNQNIGSWNINNVGSMSGMLVDVNLSVENYDALLNGWRNNEEGLARNVRFQGGNNQYCDGAGARQRLIDGFGWIITDGGSNCSLKSANLNSLSVYPNPSSETLNVSFDTTAEIEKFRIYDLIGRLLQTIDVQETEQGEQYQLNVSDLKEGTYFLQAYDSSGNAQQKQLIIK